MDRKTKKFIFRRCAAWFPRNYSHPRHSGQCKGKKKNIESGRKAGLTPLELMSAKPCAPEEGLEELMELVDQGEANNAQLRANSLLVDKCLPS